MSRTLEFIVVCLGLICFVGLVMLLIAASIAPSLALAYFLFKLTGVM